VNLRIYLYSLTAEKIYSCNWGFEWHTNNHHHENVNMLQIVTDDSGADAKYLLSLVAGCLSSSILSSNSQMKTRKATDMADFTRARSGLSYRKEERIFSLTDREKRPEHIFSRTRWRKLHIEEHHNLCCSQYVIWYQMKEDEIGGTCRNQQGDVKFIQNSCKKPEKGTM
jgi:hypothetical protein